MKNPNGFSTLVYVISLSVSWVTSFACQAAISLDDLRSQVHTYVTSQLEQSSEIQWHVDVRGLDPRIKLEECSYGTEFRLVGKNQTVDRLNTVHASCKNKEGVEIWSIYIPTQVKRMAPAVVATSHIATGQKIDAEDIKVEYVDTYSLRGSYYSSVEQIIGSKARQTIRPGQTLKSRNLCQVCKGDSIMIEAVGQGLRLITEGLSLGNATIGQPVRIQNRRSGRKISATVVSTGRVQIKI